MNLGGRPSLYKPEYCELVVKHMADGNSFWSFAAVVDVCFDTLSEWTKVHPEFSEAKRRGMAKLLAFDEKLARAGASGQLKRHSKTVTTRHKDKEGNETENEEKFYEAANFSQSYYIFMMKNRYPKLYRDKITLETETSDPSKIKDALQEVMSDPTLAEAALKIAEKFSSGE